MKDFAYMVGMMGVFICTYFFDKWKLTRNKKKEDAERPARLDAAAKIREEIDDYIKKIQAYTQACRVGLYEYTNGNYSHACISMQYVEMSFEATDETTKPLILEFKKIPVSPFLKIINAINDSKTGWIKINESDDDADIKRLNKLYKTSTSYSFRITDSVWDGVVSVSWVYMPHDLSDEQIANVEIMIMRIYGLMSKLVVKN